MGYYADVRSTVIIDEEKIEKFDERIDEYINDVDSETFSTEELSLKYLPSCEQMKDHEVAYLYQHLKSIDKIDLSEHGSLDFEEKNQKWYADKQLACFVAPYVDSGSIMFIGESDEMWSYGFDCTEKSCKVIVYNLKPVQETVIPI